MRRATSAVLFALALTLALPIEAARADFLAPSAPALEADEACLAEQDPAFTTPAAGYDSPAVTSSELSWHDLFIAGVGYTAALFGTGYLFGYLRRKGGNI